MAASRSTASGNSTPSVSMTKSKIEPFLPDEKSNHACFWSLTKNDGVFSLLNGDRPFHSRPDFINFTRRPTTSETGSRARSSSRNWGVKRMQDFSPNRGPLPTRHGYSDGQLKYEDCWDSPGYSQAFQVARSKPEHIVLDQREIRLYIRTLRGYAPPHPREKGNECCDFFRAGTRVMADEPITELVLRTFDWD